MARKKAPKGYHYMPDGKLMKDSAHKAKGKGWYSKKGIQDWQERALVVTTSPSTRNHPTKSHIVVAKDGDRVKTIRLWSKGAKTKAAEIR